MLDLLFSQQGVTSFWFPLLAAFIIFLLQLLVNRRNKDDQRPPMTFQQVNQNIQQIIYVHKPAKATSTIKRKGDGGAEGFVGLLFLATFFYQMYEAQVLQVMIGLSVFVFALWGFTLIHAYLKDIIHGVQWQGFLAATLVFIGISFFLIYLAQHPTFTNEATEAKPFAKLNQFMELAYRVIGIGLTFGGLITVLLTLTHYILRINVVTSTTTSAVSKWLLRTTKGFANPLVMGIVLTIVFALAYAFVSGYVYHLIAAPQ